MNKQTALLVGVLLVLAAIYWFGVRGSGGSSLKAGADAFAIADITQVAEIEVTSFENGIPGPHIHLRRAGENWQLNDTLFALTPRVDRLLKALKQQRVRQPLTEASQKRALQIMEERHLDVMITDTSGQVLGAFWIGPQTRDNEGSTMKLISDKSIYSVSVPGVGGYLNTYFSPFAEDWRENLLWNASMDNIAQVKAQYLEGDIMEIERLAEGWQLKMNGEVQAQSEERLAQYMSQFNGKIYGETFGNIKFPTMVDSLAKRDPDIHFTITRLDGQQNDIRLYNRPDNLNNYFGLVNGKEDLRTVQRFVMDPFLFRLGK